MSKGGGGDHRYNLLQAAAGSPMVHNQYTWLDHHRHHINSARAQDPNENDDKDEQAEAEEREEFSNISMLQHLIVSTPPPLQPSAAADFFPQHTPLMYSSGFMPTPHALSLHRETGASDHQPAWSSQTFLLSNGDQDQKLCSSSSGYLQSKRMLIADDQHRHDHGWNNDHKAFIGNRINMYVGMKHQLEDAIPSPVQLAQFGFGGYSQLLLAASSPLISSVTAGTGSGNGSVQLDFSNVTMPDDQAQPMTHRHPSGDNNSSECNSSGTGSVPKKARVQGSSSSSSAQSTLKVRKERLGERITALHQIVSPFGKTDTASVLQETIGYIRFLLAHIEALSSPYMAGHAQSTTVGGGGGGGAAAAAPNNSSSGNSTALQIHARVAEVNSGSIFPDYPGQLLNHNTTAVSSTKADDESEHGVSSDETRKPDLRSRGLCVVPVSCTSHFGTDTSADYWAPALGAVLR